MASPRPCGARSRRQGRVARTDDYRRCASQTCPPSRSTSCIRRAPRGGGEPGADDRARGRQAFFQLTGSACAGPFALVPGDEEGLRLRQSPCRARRVAATDARSRVGGARGRQPRARRPGAFAGIANPGALRALSTSGQGAPASELSELHPDGETQSQGAGFNISRRSRAATTGTGSPHAMRDLSSEGELEPGTRAGHHEWHLAPLRWRGSREVTRGYLRADEGTGAKRGADLQQTSITVADSWWLGRTTAAAGRRHGTQASFGASSGLPIRARGPAR